VNVSATANDSIIWNNSVSIDGDDVSYGTSTFEMVNSCYSDTTGAVIGAGAFTATSCVTTDPLFVAGPSGSYYLNQSLSPAVDAGDDDADEYGMDTKTTDPSGTPDSGTVDLGYHYPLP
jgi:hypothetical protein